jgi:hypothetical protein
MVLTARVTQDCLAACVQCAQTGLQEVTTTFALVAQHDRAFIDRFDDLQRVLNTMTRCEWIRYVGFPSVMNRQHANLLHCKYGLKELAATPRQAPALSANGS